MKPYWNQPHTPRQGLGILEVENHYDNVYIKDSRGRVWQIVIAFEMPEIRLVNVEVGD